MAKSDIQCEQVSFRQESVDNVFSQGGKPFFVQSPPNLSKYTFVLFSFLIFVFASIYFIKLPVYINAIGEVIAGKDYHQIVVNDDDKVVSNIMVSEGDALFEGQVLLQLDTRDEISKQAKLADIQLQIQALEAHISEVEKFYLQNIQNIALTRDGQLSIVNQLEKQFDSEKITLAKYQKNVANGLTSALLVDTQKRIVSNVESHLIKEKSVFTSLELQQLNIQNNYKLQKDSDQTQIARLEHERKRLNSGLQIMSPCDCMVDNIFIENGIPVTAGQSILTLSQARAKSLLMLYVPANEYREIEKGSQIQVNVASYPSNQYGALKATVVKVSASPVPGNMIGKKGQGLQNTTYFIVKAMIDLVPSNVTLVTGMSVDSDIVIDKISLFDLMFNFNKNR